MIVVIFCATAYLFYLEFKILSAPGVFLTVVDDQGNPLPNSSLEINPNGMPNGSFITKYKGGIQEKIALNFFNIAYVPLQKDEPIDIGVNARNNNLQIHITPPRGREGDRDLNCVTYPLGGREINFKWIKNQWDGSSYLFFNLPESNWIYLTVVVPEKMSDLAKSRIAPMGSLSLAAFGFENFLNNTMVKYNDIKKEDVKRTLLEKNRYSHCSRNGAKGIITQDYLDLSYISLTGENLCSLKKHSEPITHLVLSSYELINSDITFDCLKLYPELKSLYLKSSTIDKDKLSAILTSNPLLKIFYLDFGMISVAR